LSIRLPINVRSAFFPIRRHLEKARTAFGPGRVNDELARHCAEDKRFFRQWLAFERAVDVRSLSDPQEPEYFEARTVAAPADDEPLHRVLHREQIERIRATLECLQPRQRRLIRLRYGMEGDPLTLEEIGLAEGITRERVRQILLRAEERLRHFMERKLTDLVPMTSVVVTDAETEMESGPTSV
jgi:RNA polymerase primary sigma factor